MLTIFHGSIQYIHCIAVGLISDAVISLGTCFGNFPSLIGTSMPVPLFIRVYASVIVQYQAWVYIRNADTSVCLVFYFPFLVLSSCSVPLGDFCSAQCTYSVYFQVLSAYCRTYLVIAVRDDNIFLLSRIKSLFFLWIHSIFYVGIRRIRVYSTFKWKAFIRHIIRQL